MTKSEVMIYIVINEYKERRQENDKWKHCITARKKKKIGKQNWFISYYFRFTLSIRFTTLPLYLFPTLFNRSLYRLNCTLRCYILYSIWYLDLIRFTRIVGSIYPLWNLEEEFAYRYVRYRSNGHQRGKGNPKIDLHKPIVTSDTIKENI